MTKKELKRFKRMKKEAELINDFFKNGGKSVEMIPIKEDVFGDGVPRMITVWKMGE